MFMIDAFQFVHWEDVAFHRSASNGKAACTHAHLHRKLTGTHILGP